MVPCWMLFMRFFLILVLPVLLLVFLTFSHRVIPVYHIIVGVKTWGEACDAYQYVAEFQRLHSCPSRGQHFICFPLICQYAANNCICYCRHSVEAQQGASIKLHRKLTSTYFRRISIKKKVNLRTEVWMLLRHFATGERRIGNEWSGGYCRFVFVTESLLCVVLDRWHFDWIDFINLCSAISMNLGAVSPWRVPEWSLSEHEIEGE